MAKEVIVIDGKYYFYDAETCEFFEIHIDKMITPSKKMIKAAIDQTVALEVAKAKGK